MVDRIKFSVDNALINEEILKRQFFEGITNKDGNKFYLYKNNFVEDDEVDETQSSEETEKNLSDPRYKKYLYIKYVVYGKPKNLPSNGYSISSELIVHRNLRKDQFDEGTIADLRYNNFLKVIEKYIKKFDIDEKVFWNSRVTKLELGVTLRLSSKMKGILSCFDNFNGLAHKNIYGNDGISFVGENFSVSIYNKLRKMEKNGELFRNSTNKKMLIEKVTKNNYILRLELKIEKVSGFYRDSFSGKINRLKGIRDNWNYLGKALLDIYSDINYIDIISPEVEDTISGKERMPMNRFLQFKGIQSIGVDRFFNQLLPLMKDVKSSQSKFRKEYREFYNEYERKFRVDYENEFATKLEDRITSLMKKN